MTVAENGLSHRASKPLRQLPKPLRREYERALRGVPRWKNGIFLPDVPETDMDHVNGMLNIFNEIEKSCPLLTQSVRRDTVRNMIYIHDAGEIINGDLAHLDPDYNKKHDKHKRKEHLGFRLILLGRITDAQLRTKIGNLYQRVIAKKDTDKETLLTDLIDKAQGNRFGFEHVFPGSKLAKDKPIRQMQMNHAIEIISKPANCLIKIFRENPLVQIEILKFCQREIEFYAKSGYKKEARMYLDWIRSVLEKFPKPS